MSDRWYAGFGALCVLASLALFGALHVLPPTAELDWSRRTISQYALTENGWAFDAGTLLLAAGSAAVLVLLVRVGLVGRGPGGTAAAIALVLWIAGLVGVVGFEKHDWAVGQSMSGDIHRVASVVAFVSLPAGALLAAVPRIGETGARLVVAGAVAALICFLPIVWAFVSEPWTGVRWWRAIPLGGVERLLGLAEVVTVMLLAWWAAAKARAVHVGAAG